MKVFVFLFAYVLLATSHQVPPNIINAWRKLIAPYKSECICATNVNPVLLERVINHLEFTNDACFKCAIRCLAVKLNIMDSSGEINAEILKKRCEGVTDEIAQQCTSSTKAELDSCQKAYDVALCVVTSVRSQSALKFDIN